MARSSVPRPQKRRPPSERDQEIFAACKVHLRPQVEVAKELGVCKSRVSQICRKVREWFAEVSPRDGELDHGQQLRLERRLERERLEMLYGESLRMLREFEQPAKTTRLGKRKGEKSVEVTKRDRSAQRIQALKSALKAAESLGQLAEREPAPEPAGGKALRADHLFADLSRRRLEAEAEGRVPAGAEPYDVAWYVLRAMTGEKISPAQANSALQTALATVAEALAVASGTEEASEVAASQSAQLAQPADASADSEMPPEVAAVLAASGWRDPRYGAARPLALAAADNGLAWKKTAELSAADGAPARAAPAGPALPEVGSPEWQVARARWLAERDQRRIQEAAQKYAEQREREEDLRQRRTAAVLRRPQAYN